MNSRLTGFFKHALQPRALAVFLPLALAGAAGSRIAWEDLTESDWMYSLATRFALVDGHRVHYPTPTAELARALESRQESAALRQLAEAKLSLGDRKGAIATMEKWAEAEGKTSAAAGADAWAETARWAAAHQELAAAFKAAERALPGLPDDARRSLADERITWADQHPDLADPIALRQARSQLFPRDARTLEDWLRTLEKADRLEEADRALAASKALPPERNLLLRSDLRADHGDRNNAFKVLDEAVAEAWSVDFRHAYAARVDKAVPGAPDSWRSTLETRYDASTLVRLATYFQGQNRGDAVTELLQQMERRHDAALTRKDHLLLARLYGEIDAVPEAFRATLAAAHQGTAEEQKIDLAALARLALRAGGRPLALGITNDETYRWAAALDRTPGFWTGAVSFLLTGMDWNDAMNRLESESLPDRTFATALALAAELARRAPQHPELASLRVALMERHVERGEGRKALDLLSLAENANPAVADQARRVALLAARQVEIPLNEELRLTKARLRYLATDGSHPGLGSEDEEIRDSYGESSESRPWARLPRSRDREQYHQVLEESISRLESRDRNHVASLGLILGEMDRLPNAEELWLMLASRLENWNLDDELGPRYEKALQRFQGSGIWARTARWYARRNHSTELRSLAETIAKSFRGAAIFDKAQDAGEVRVEIPDQPPVAGRVRMVLWADWIRLKALERYPHSPRVYQEAQRLVTLSNWQAHYDPAKVAKQSHAPTIVSDALMEERRWALLFTDPSQRESYLGQCMSNGNLQEKLVALEQRRDRTPVEEQLLFEGWARLSQFERAYQAADRLSANYPGDGVLAQRVLSLHRSLNGLDPSHAVLAKAVVARTAPTLEDPTQLWTELGELEEERGRPEAAITVWRKIVENEPRNPQRLSELATLLWDYNHDSEALSVVEDGRKRLNRPRFFAFETGVLRENVKDLEGAVREYLDAVRPEDGYGSWFERDQRSLRRLAQLLARQRVYRIVERRIQALTPGVKEDERALTAFYPMATIEMPDPGLTWDADAWIDDMDMPNDAMGRAQRTERKEAERPKEYDAIQRIGDLMLEKTQQMIPKASAPEFLDLAEAWSGSLIETRWKKDQIIGFKNAVLARRAALTPNEEERIRQEVTRARFLAENQRVSEADNLWASLNERIGALPEGVSKIKVEAERAGYLERAKGSKAAAEEWRRLGARYPWSLGLLEDRLAFLNRSNMGEEARALLEGVLPKAAAGHREELLEKLTQDSLAASDLPRARRAVGLLLAEEGLDETRRLGAIHLLTRLSLKENAAWDPYPLAKVEAIKLRTDLHADLYHEMARAADIEALPGTAMGLWIEALNRRTERDWLQSACRSARRAGKDAELLGFFEKQHTRSPRDVRWAVAVRDIKQAFHQVEGALEAAKSAVAVRPEKEELWREASELLVRADRIQEAADYLEGWNRPRPADEGVARWRADLYSRAGQGERALAIEKAALDAYAKESPKETRELAERRARAANRLLDLGHPTLALKLYSGAGDIRALAGSRVSFERQSVLALLLNQFPRLLDKQASEGGFLSSAASVLNSQGRPEQKEEVLNFLANRIFPSKAQQPDNALLDQWWSFVVRSGLEHHLRLALSQRILASRPGPWQTSTSWVFAYQVGSELVGPAPSSDGPTKMIFREPDLPRLWARDLARLDRSAELLIFLEPRWQELLAQVRGNQNVNSKSDRLAWASWLDDESVLETWALAAASRPEKIHELSEIMSERRLWDRFWVLAARHWHTTPLVALLPQESRQAWYRFWETTVPQQDPVIVARRNKVEAVTTALERLIQGQAKAAEDALIVKLRGPQTIGEVLSRGSQWVWPEFTPRRNAKGELLETGDDRVTGGGVDEGRLPGALWGERPGEAWYVLETLVRYRKGDHSAPLVPLDIPQRGNETQRILLAIRMARTLGDLPLALELETTHPGAAQDRSRLEMKLSLLNAAGRSSEAADAFQAYLRRGQGKLTEEEFRSLSNLAEELNLPAPLTLLDPDQPVGPVFLAYLRDKSPDVFLHFQTSDPVGYRIALTNRWRAREAQLSAEQIRTWLRELWVTDSAPLPNRGLARLGGVWPASSEWLQRLPVPERQAALEALEGMPSNARLFDLLAQSDDDTARLLAVRARLLRNERDRALFLVDQMLSEFQNHQPLNFSVPSRSDSPAPEEGSETGETGAEETSAPPPSDDAMVNRLKAWLVPFQEAKDSQAVEARFRKFLQERRAEGKATLSAWKLAFQLTPETERSNLAKELDEAWFREEISPDELGALVGTLATLMPSEAPRWLVRWPQNPAFSHVRERVAVLVQLKQPMAAAKVIFESRRRALWNSGDEVRAFDTWRRFGASASPEAKAPGTWAAALPFWTGRTPLAALGERLKAHSFDVLSGRSVLSSVAPGDEDILRRALSTPEGGTAHPYDERLVRLRAARAYLPVSWRAAQHALGSMRPDEAAGIMAERRVKAAEANAALADLARIAGKAGDEVQMQSALSLLTERKAANLKALRAELALNAPARQATYNLVNGRPAPIRPRDLSWPMLAKLLKAEGVR